MKKFQAKLISYVLCSMLCLGLFTGCGSREGSSQAGNSQQTGASASGNQQTSGGRSNTGANASGTEDSSAASSSIALPGSELVVDSKMLKSIDLLSTVFYREEAVEIKRTLKHYGDVLTTQDIYIRNESGEGELIIQDAPSEYEGKWYYTEEGYCLVLWKKNVIRINADGTEVYNKTIEKGVSDLCQLADGRIMMLMTEGTGDVKLAELDPETGDHTKFDSVKLTKDKKQYIAPGGNGLLLMSSTGFWDVNLETGELTRVADWKDYEYMLGYAVQDFRLHEDGVLDILLNEKRDIMLPQNVIGSRITIAVYTNYADLYMQEAVEEFNKRNATYYVELYTRNDAPNREVFDSGIESALIDGVGVDIVSASCLTNISDKIQNGLFENLTPYMEQSGICKEDYFPGTFSYEDGEKVFGCTYQAYTTGLAISKGLLGENTEPDAESLVDALLNYEGDEVFHSAWGASNVLNYFLCGSEDMWGMIDWENKTCDFEGVLFSKMLEAAKLYGNGGVRDQAALAEWASSSFYGHTSLEVLNEKEMEYVGYLFDDGCYGVAGGGAYLISGASENKEGAWKFLSYLLSENLQSEMNYRYIPANRAAYDAVAAREIEQTARYVERTSDGSRVTYKAGSQGKMSSEDYVLAYSLTTEKAEEIKDRLDNARHLPGATSAIRNIILEEAAAYFEGSAYAADVCDNIQKRVQQYLDESVE